MKKINFLDSINILIITEKATVLSEQNKTVFKVHKNDHEDKSLYKWLERILLTAALIPANSIHVQSLGQEVRSVLAVKLTVRVKTQLMKVLTDVALSLQISEM